MLNIFITQSAEQDIKQAVAWWSENRSPAQAANWYKHVFLAIDTLREMPQRCPAARETIDYKLNLRQLLFGMGRKATHRIIFDISENDVRIWRILHLSRDNFDLEISE